MSPTMSASPNHAINRGIFASHFWSQGTCDDYSSQAGCRGRNHVKASGAGYLAPDTAPPQRGGELSQMFPAASVVTCRVKVVSGPLAARSVLERMPAESTGQRAYPSPPAGEQPGMGAGTEAA